MSSLTVHVATDDMVSRIISGLRDADRREVELSSGKPAGIILRESVALSDWARVAALDGDPVVLYGLAAIQPGIGAPWMVATDRIREIGRQFMPACRREVDIMQRQYPLLWNRVATFNTCSIRWLRRLGFTVATNVLTGTDSAFHDFTRTAPDV